ncbi:MAG: hypothetical protein MMC33_004986 [Icmadophila ericetorum]|nr:hypothetical protein [Icmadophila ericetorum]
MQYFAVGILVLVSFAQFFVSGIDIPVLSSPKVAARMYSTSPPYTVVDAITPSPFMSVATMVVAPVSEFSDGQPQAPTGAPPKPTVVACVTVTETITVSPYTCSVDPSVTQAPIIIMQSNSTLAIALPPKPSAPPIVIIPPPQSLNVTTTPNATGVMVAPDPISPALPTTSNAATSGKTFGTVWLAFGVVLVSGLYLCMI